jgi:hypothetical protein
MRYAMHVVLECNVNCIIYHVCCGNLLGRISEKQMRTGLLFYVCEKKLVLRSLLM